MVISASKSERQSAWELAYLVRLSTPAVPTLAQRFAEVYAKFDESSVDREPSGKAEGGQFASGGGDDKEKQPQTKGEPEGKRKVKPLEATELSAALRKAGLSASKRRLRDPLTGFKIERIQKKHAFMVTWEDWADVNDDHQGQSEKMETILTEAGFVVKRPFPDTAMLGVYRVDKPKQYAAGTYDRSQLAIGTRIEMEHTHDPNIARKIALDHLRERGDYYTLLQKMEDDPKFLQANYAKDKAMVARNKLIDGLSARFSRGVEIIHRYQQAGCYEPELGMPRPNEFRKVDVNYRAPFSSVRCAVCEFSSGKSCKLVKGDYDGDAVCDMFKAETPKTLSWRIEDTPAPA